MFTIQNKSHLLWIPLILMAWLIQPSVMAQGVRFSVDAPKVVSVGEQFQITWTLNAKPSSDITTPAISDFSVLFGPSTSQQQSYSSINGKMTQSFEMSYTYVLQALKTGTFTVGSAKIMVDKQQYLSEPVSIQVIAGSASSSPVPGAQGQTSSQGSAPQSYSSNQVQPDNDVFVRVLTNKTTAYPGEPITVDIKLYSRENIASLGNAEFPTFDGFFKEDIDIPAINGLVQENVNGVVYGTAVLKKFVLFPQKSGTITIDPFSLECVIQRQVKSSSRSIFDDFFGPSVESVPLLLTSNPVKITVKNLPSEAKPGLYDGAVGQFKMQTSVDKSNLQTNAAATLRITISGSGNIRFLNVPKIEFPAELEVYDPKSEVNLNALRTGGTKSFDYVIIPRQTGSFMIPSVEFPYFDNTTGTYKTLRSEPVSLKVEAGEGGQASIAGSAPRESVQVVGRDIRYLKTGDLSLKSIDYVFFGSGLFWFFNLLACAAFAATLVIRRNHIKKYSNIALLKNKRANQYASKRLKLARSYMIKEEKEAFFEEVSKAMWGYLSDKLNINVADLSRDSAKNALEEEGVEPELVQSFLDLMDTCEYARYAPSSSGITLSAVYENAISLIGKVQNALKNKIS